MPNSIPTSTLSKFTTFGDLLRFLRRRAGITQVELSIAVGYSDPQISRLEQNLRLPDIPTLEARFVKPLYLEEEPQALARLLELAADVRREDAPALGLCPYKGLDYFDEADADLFVGREALTEKLITRVLSLASINGDTRGKFFAVVGASGSGKSSLVRAGLVPALRWNKSSTTWLIQVLAPTAHPLERLASTLTRANGSLAATAKLMDDLAIELRTLSLYIRHEIKTSPGSYFLLVIDQFEELFALCRSEEERSAFIDNLLNAANDRDSKIIIVITLRADFYAHCSNYPRLREALASHQEYIGAMSDEEMRRAIEEPARRGRWEFEPGLVDLILHDVGHEPGALPLLSHALFETWQRRHGRIMTLSGYTSAGGVRGAIAETAETVFADQFTRQQQVIARRIFIRLTELGDETASGDTRRQASFNELILNPEDSEATQVVLKALADARLVTTSENSVQVAHEALIREWPTLRGWLEENREGLRLQRQLTDATQEWLTALQETDILLRGARLAQAREWAEAHAEDMNVQEREFLAASIEASEREAAEREAARQRELESAQKLTNNERQRAKERGRAVILVSAIGILAVILAVIAFFSWRSSAFQSAHSRSLILATNAQDVYETGSGDLALALALESVDIANPPAEALKILRTIALSPGTRAVLNGHSQVPQVVAISPDNRMGLSSSCAQLGAQDSCLLSELILWDLVNGGEIKRWTGHNSSITELAFSQDGHRLISGGNDGSLILWDLEGHKFRDLKGQPGSISSLVITKNGNLLSGSTDGSLVLWDLDTGEMLRSYEGIISGITAIAVAKDNLFAVSAHADATLYLWNLNDISPVNILKQDGIGAIDAVAVNADGSQIFITTGPQISAFLRMINSKDGRLLHEQSIIGPTDDLVISPDGAYVLYGFSNIIQQWNVQSGLIQGYLWGHAKNITDIAISADGRLALSSSEDGTLRVWNLGIQLDLKTYDLQLSGMPNAIDVSSDGKYLLLATVLNNGMNELGLFDIAENKIIRTYLGANLSVPPGGAKISPDAKYVAVAGTMLDSGIPVVMIWELESGIGICKYIRIPAMARAVAFSPNSQSLLVGTQDPINNTGQLSLLDIKTCEMVRQFDNTEDVASIAFSADGNHAITGTGYFARAILWDVATGKEIRRFSYGTQLPLLDLAYGPNESTLIATTDSGLIEWDIETGEIVQRFMGPKAFVWSMDLSPDNEYALAGANNGDVAFWDYSSGEEIYQFNFQQSVLNVEFSQDGTAFLSLLDGRLIEWHIAEQPLPQLLDWINANRYVRPLTCDERQQYHIGPLCSQE